MGLRFSKLLCFCDLLVCNFFSHLLMKSNILIRNKVHEQYVYYCSSSHIDNVGLQENIIA
jgi:hypothetical protein